MDFFSWMASPAGWMAFATLVALEIVLGIDNVVFISILSNKLPEHQRAKARTLGLGLAMFMRIALLFSLSWIVTLTNPIFTLDFLQFLDPTAAQLAANEAAHKAGEGSGHKVTGLASQISGRDLIMLFGGLFLIYKAVTEIHHKLEGVDHASTGKVVVPTFAAVITQILLIDIVFSLDSVITAVGMVDNISIMITAVVVTVLVMLVAAGPISNFVEKRPTVKMLALSFLLLIGVMLFAEGFDKHIEKGYIYFAMAFSVVVEMLNLKLRKDNAKPVELRH